MKVKWVRKVLGHRIGDVTTHDPKTEPAVESWIRSGLVEPIDSSPPDAAIVETDVNGGNDG